MKETIEFERPEGLPDDAVPTVIYVARAPHVLSAVAFDEYWANGQFRCGPWDPKHMHKYGFNLPEERHSVAITGLTIQDIHTLKSIALGQVPNSALAKLWDGLDTYLINLEESHDAAES